MMRYKGVVGSICLLLTYFIIVTPLMLSCGGGGGTTSGTGGSSGNVTLSKTTADPGEFLTISKNSISAGSEVTVQFKGANGYQINLPSSDTYDGSVKVPVPPFFDTQTGSFMAGDVQVSVNGVEADESLKINTPPSTGLPNGDVIVLFAQAAIDEYNICLSNLDQMVVDLGGQLDVSAMKKSINDQIDFLDDIIFQIQFFGDLILATPDGSITVSAQQLKTVDQLLLSSLTGMTDELNARGLASASASSYRTTKELSTPQDIIDGINHVIDEAKRGFEGGNVLLSGTAVIVVVGGIWFEAPIVAAAGGTALVYMAVGWDFGTSAIYDQMTTSFNNLKRSTYDWGYKAIKALIRAATELGSAVSGGFWTALAVAQEIISGMQAAENMKCDQTNNDQQSYSSDYYKKVGAYQMNSTVQNFCVIILPPPGGDSNITFPITYSGSGTYSSSITLSWGEKGSITCSSSPEWSITLKADGTLEAEVTIKKVVGHDSTGRAFCADRPDATPYKKFGTHSNGHFSIDYSSLCGENKLTGTYDSNNIVSESWSCENDYNSGTVLVGTVHSVTSHFFNLPKSN